MTEQRIDPALWRAVADELERIASAEWPVLYDVLSGMNSAALMLPLSVQRLAIMHVSFLRGMHPTDDPEPYRYLLRALAGALRIEANWAESKALAAAAEKIQAEQATCPNCGIPVGWDVQICACGIEL